MNTKLVTNAGNLKFWKQVQEEISESNCPVFLCTHSATFGTNWKNIAFIKEVHYLANKFLVGYISPYKIIVNTIIRADEPLFDIMDKHDNPIQAINGAKVRTDFLGWIINYLTSLQNQ